MKMKTKTLLIMLIAVTVVSGLFGCSKINFSPGPDRPIGPQGELGPSSENAIHIESSDVIVKTEYQLSGFSEIEVGDFFDVEIRQGETYRVIVEADETITSYHDIVVRGKTLHIGLNPNYTYNIESARQRVEVTLPALTHIRISNHSTSTLEGFEAEEDMRVDVADFSTLSGSITAGVVEVEVTNHSDLTLRGSASQVVGEVTDFSSADLARLDTAEVELEVDGKSMLK
jgi:hypothetical protein